MGDFERTFGAGADAESIIDGYGTINDNYDDSEGEMIEIELWFPNYAEAEAWEKANPNTVFTRRRHLGGFQVTLRDRQSKAEHWRYWSKYYSGSFLDNDDAPLELVYAEGLKGHEICHGTFKISLADDASSLLVDFLDRLRDEVPINRITMSPIVMTKKDFQSLFNGMSKEVSFDIDLGGGAAAIFAKDHYLIPGRALPEKQVAFWPWLLRMECGGGRFNANGEEACFLCDHNDDDGYIPQDTHYSPQNLYSNSRELYRHFVSHKHYAGKITRSDLAKCIKDWVDVLSPLDSQLKLTHRAPSNVIAFKREEFISDRNLNRLCEALACVIATQKKINDGVAVIMSSSHDTDSLPQSEPVTLNHFWLKGPNENVEAYYTTKMPDLSGLDFSIPPPNWQDAFELRPREDNPGRTLSGGHVATGWFKMNDLTSAHQRVKAEQIAQTILEGDLHPAIREFLNSPPR